MNFLKRRTIVPPIVLRQSTWNGMTSGERDSIRRATNSAGVLLVPDDMYIELDKNITHIRKGPF